MHTSVIWKACVVRGVCGVGRDSVSADPGDPGTCPKLGQPSCVLANSTSPKIAGKSFPSCVFRNPTSLKTQIAYEISSKRRPKKACFFSFFAQRISRILLKGHVGTLFPCI